VSRASDKHVLQGGFERVTESIILVKVSTIRETSACPFSLRAKLTTEQGRLNAQISLQSCREAFSGSLVAITITSPPICSFSESVCQRNNDALMQNQYSIAAVAFVDQMRRQQDRYAVLVAQTLKIIPQVNTGSRVQSNGWLIQNEQFRAMQQSFASSTRR